jgi:hypothetical protein
MGFSSILDISSFFIGMIINLIFVALMCYYFKRKYDYLEVAQNEQAKILYQLIHKPSSHTPSPPVSVDYSQDPLLTRIVSECESDSDSDSDSEEEMEEIQDVHVENVGTDSEIEPMDTHEIKIVDLEIKNENTEHLSVEEVKKEEPLNITVNLVEDSETNYSKMSMKQLKEVLSSKGIKAKTNIKKEELLELITNEVRV